MQAPTKPQGSLTAFFTALLARFGAIVGEGAGCATFHFAAMQSGLEVGRAASSLQEALLEADRVLEVGDQDHGSPITVKVPAGPLADGGPIVEGVLTGFYEGVLRGATNVVHEGKFSAIDGGATIVFKPKADA